MKWCRCGKPIEYSKNFVMRVKNKNMSENKKNIDIGVVGIFSNLQKRGMSDEVVSEVPVVRFPSMR
jgi:phospholipid N-methyltransferase